MSQQLGAFEVQKTCGDHGIVLRQVVLETPVWTCKADYYNHTINVIGDFGWYDEIKRLYKLVAIVAWIYKHYLIVINSLVLTLPLQN